MSARELPNEILLLPWIVMAAGKEWDWFQQRIMIFDYCQRTKDHDYFRAVSLLFFSEGLIFMHQEWQIHSFHRVDLSSLTFADAGANAVLGLNCMIPCRGGTIPLLAESIHITMVIRCSSRSLHIANQK